MMELFLDESANRQMQLSSTALKEYAALVLITIKLSYLSFIKSWH